MNFDDDDGDDDYDDDDEGNVDILEEEDFIDKPMDNMEAHR